MSNIIADILIVDDHPMMRKGVKQLIEMEDDLTCVGEAGNHEQALEIALNTSPDLILLDYNMPEQNGLQVLKKLRDAKVDSRILLFTVEDDAQLVRKAIQQGADGYLLKDMEPEQLIENIRKVLKGGLVISDILAKGLVEPVSQSLDLDVLTSREQQVLMEIAKGCSNKVIANNLDIAESTVKVHVKRLLSKLNMRSRVEAAVWVSQNLTAGK